MYIDRYPALSISAQAFYVDRKIQDGEFQPGDDHRKNEHIMKIKDLLKESMQIAGDEVTLL